MLQGKIWKTRHSHTGIDKRCRSPSLHDRRIELLQDPGRLRLAVFRSTDSSESNMFRELARGPGRYIGSTSAYKGAFPPDLGSCVELSVSANSSASSRSPDAALEHDPRNRRFQLTKRAIARRIL